LKYTNRDRRFGGAVDKVVINGESVKGSSAQASDVSVTSDAKSDSEQEKVA